MSVYYIMGIKENYFQEFFFYIYTLDIVRERLWSSCFTVFNFKMDKNYLNKFRIKSGKSILAQTNAKNIEVLETSAF